MQVYIIASITCSVFLVGGTKVVVSTKSGVVNFVVVVVVFVVADAIVVVSVVVVVGFSVFTPTKTIKFCDLVHTIVCNNSKNVL